MKKQYFVNGIQVPLPVYDALYRAVAQVVSQIDGRFVSMRPPHRSATVLVWDNRNLVFTVVGDREDMVPDGRPEDLIEFCLYRIESGRAGVAEASVLRRWCLPVVEEGGGV